MSVRALTLATIAVIALAGSGVMTLAQPGSDAPKPPATAPKDPAGGQPGGPGGPGGGGGRPGGERGFQPGGGGQRGEGASVRQGMSIMNRALRTLKAQVTDAAKKDDNLKLINDIQRGCATAKGAPTDRVLGRIEEAKRAEMAINYRKALIQIMEKALKAEVALMDGKTADASTLVGEIEKIRDDSHKLLGVKDDHDEGRGEGGGGGRGPRGGGGGDGAPPAPGR